MDKFIEYAPTLVLVIIFIIQYKIFVTPQQLTEMRAEMQEYISEHYVSQATYRDNHNRLERRIDNIDKNINDMRNLLINFMSSHNINN